MGLEIDGLSYEIEGDVDPHAFLGLGKGRPSFTEIKVKSRVKSSNAIRDILANPVPVKTDLEVL